MIQRWQHWLGPVVVLLGGLTLPFIIPESELAWLTALGAVIAATIAWRTGSRWVVSLVGLFLWTFVAFYVHRLGSSWQAFSVFLVYLAGMVGTVRLLPDLSLGRVLLAQAVGIAVAELFLILLFWPIHFLARALLMTTFGLVLFELVELREAGMLSWRKIRGAVALSVVVLVAIVWTSDWMSF